MANSWMAHLKAYRAKHKGMTLSEAMKGASKSYKKKADAKGKGTKKGGARKGRVAGSRLAYDDTKGKGGRRGKAKAKSSGAGKIKEVKEKAESKGKGKGKK